jgi:serpin B
LRSVHRIRRGWFVVALGLVVALSACGQPPSPDGSSAGDAVEEPTNGPEVEPTVDPVVERPTPDSADVEDLVVGINEVGYQIFGAGSQDSVDDLVVSPLSIGVAFGMADAGASGATADALTELFDYPAKGEDRWAAFNALEQSVATEGGDGPMVRLANRQFPDVSFETVDGYDELLGRWFGAGIEPLPLRSESEASRERINGWVSERTEGLIPKLLPAGFLDPSSVKVLVNALYLEADWARPFGKYPTKDATFTRLDGSTVTVPLMHELELTGPAVATDEYAATELPYEGDELSMLVIVPEDGHYEQVEAQLTDGLVDEIDAAATSGAVELYLPRFESSTNLDLRGVLEDQLGVNDVFGVPGFEGIAPDIALEGAVHATDIAVDEVGTVAAAAGALGFQDSGPPQPDVTVRADRPFLYLIRHQPTGAVLFVGRVMDPDA